MLECCCHMHLLSPTAARARAKLAPVPAPMPPLSLRRAHTRSSRARCASTRRRRYKGKKNLWIQYPSRTGAYYRWICDTCPCEAESRWCCPPRTRRRLPLHALMPSLRRLCRHQTHIGPIPKSTYACTCRRLLPSLHQAHAKSGRTRRRRQ